MSDTTTPDGRDRPLPVQGSLDEEAMTAARDEAIALLSECFARDVLTMEDFERRADLAHGARTVAELGAAIDGIPTGALQAQAGGPAAAAAPGVSTKPHDHAIAAFSETKRQGRWIPAQRNTVVAAWGSAVIDLREALMGPGQTVVSAFAFMGAVEVIVPPGMHVDCSGSAVFGAFEEQREFAPVPVGLGAPTVRVEGFALFGSVAVERRQVDESRREARMRRRREKRERKRLRR